MSLLEQQNLLARLYTDAEFRRAFLSEPEKTGAGFDLSAAEIREIGGVLPEELEFFADSLFWKRLREVEKFLPLTRKVLGGGFATHFREFSQKYNPQTVKKHFEDAVEFCRFLQSLRPAPVGAIDVVKFEEGKLYFYSGLRNFVLIKLGSDVRPFIEKEVGEKTFTKARKNRKKTFAIWFRVGKMEKHFIF